MNLDAPRQPTKDFAVPDDAPERADLIYYRMAGKKRKASATWWRGETTNFHPVRESLAEPDAVEKYIGHGWLPPAPFITRDQYITAFGSCFAGEVTRFLLRAGYRVFGGDLKLRANVIRSGEGIVHSAGLRQQFEWAWTGRAPAAGTWHEKDGAAADASEENRQQTGDIFDRTEVFIFTLGLSEVWYDRPTGEVFWRAIPKDVFDPERHGFRIMGPEENAQNLRAVVDLIRARRPDAPVIFTLSPVPLAATFRPVSCISANSVSKASLRFAIDQVMRDCASDERLFYFPSYEIVTAFLPDAMGDDLRHPRPETVDFIMAAFARHFLAGEPQP